MTAPSKEPKENSPEKIGYWLLGALLVIGAVFIIFKEALSTHIPWTLLKQHIRDGEVAALELDGELLNISYANDAPSERANTVKQSVYVPNDTEFLSLVESQSVQFEALPPSFFERYGPIFHTVIILGFIFYILSRLQQLNPSRSAIKNVNAQVDESRHLPIRFSDVAGVDEAIEEVRELVDFLKNPAKFTGLGGKIPKGVLLVGPPGTGKTLLARAIAGEADVPFFRASGSDFVELYVGVGASRVRDLFKKAREQAPCIIFVDELDAIGKTRQSASIGGGSEEREQTLNQILVELDGFDGRSGIIMIAATNRPESLDKALLRPGRFDRQVLVDLPDINGRIKILEVHAQNIVLDETVDLVRCAQLTTGFSGADLANILNEAALLAARQDKTAVDFSDIEAAIERNIAGLEKRSKRLSDKERNIIAVHECGHAICAAANPASDPVHKISIIPRGIGALGYTLQTPQEDRQLYNTAELKARLVTLYGGRMAEAEFFSHITTGAADDIRRATELATRMVTELGMSEQIGPVSYQERRNNAFGIGANSGPAWSCSTDMAQELEKARRDLLQEAHQESLRIIQKNRLLLEEMKNVLLEKEILDGETLQMYLQRVQGIQSTLSIDV
ncbi:MAG: ATP-dependent zinc metalloprotease FtsH [Myxococcota bacterium]